MCFLVNMEHLKKGCIYSKFSTLVGRLCFFGATLVYKVGIIVHLVIVKYKVIS